jgi:hypothetical protein
MVGKMLVVISAIALVLLGTGAFFLINSITPLEKEDVILNDTFNVLGNRYDNKTAWLKNNVDYSISFTASDSVIKFYPMHEIQFSIWQQGQFEPQWVESDQYHMMIGGTGDPGGGVTYYFVFFNNKTSTIEVHLEVSNTWQETNHIALLGGAALVLSGSVIGVIVIYRQKKL